MQDKIYILIAAGAIMFAVIGGLSLLACKGMPGA